MISFTADLDILPNPFLLLYKDDKVSMGNIRDLIFHRLNIYPKAKCVILLSRSTTQSKLMKFKSKTLLDMSRDEPGLAAYHDTGDHIYTALHYNPTTSQQRRFIINEKDIFMKLQSVLEGKYGVCVKMINLDDLSIREQFKVFSTAKLVIAQVFYIIIIIIIIILKYKTVFIV